MSSRVALVTGAAGGIGRAICARLLRDGYRLAISDRSATALDAARAGIGAHQGAAVPLPGDLADAGFCEQLVALALAEAGGLDLLVNNAGLMRRGDILATSDADYQASFAVNVEAPFRLSRAAIAHMRGNGGGAIVNVASCWGIYPGPAHVVYCMSKAALASLTRCLGRDHARDGIRVNAVCPNEVDTPMLRSGFATRGLDPVRAVEALNESVPLGHIAAPEEIADVVGFLASDDARYLCGALLEVSGGKPVY